MEPITNECAHCFATLDRYYPLTAVALCAECDGANRPHPEMAYWPTLFCGPRDRDAAIELAYDGDVVWDDIALPADLSRIQDRFDLFPGWAPAFRVDEGVFERQAFERQRQWQVKWTKILNNDHER